MATRLNFRIPCLEEDGKELKFANRLGVVNRERQLPTNER